MHTPVRWEACRQISRIEDPTAGLETAPHGALDGEGLRCISIDLALCRKCLHRGLKALLREILSAQRQIDTDTAKTLTIQRHVALFLGQLSEIAPALYDRPSVIPSAVELLALTLLTYVVPAFDYLGDDKYTDELIRPFTTWLADYLVVLDASKSGAPWPASIPSDKTFPRLLP